MLTAALLAGCASTLQADADAEAERVADHVLPVALDEMAAASDTSDPDARALAVARWLADPGPSAMDGQRATWALRQRDGARLRVDLYARVESGSFFPPDQGRSAWGVACRTYVVGEGVLVVPIRCPDGTPATP